MIRSTRGTHMSGRPELSDDPARLANNDTKSGSGRVRDPHEKAMMRMGSAKELEQFFSERSWTDFSAHYEQFPDGAVPESLLKELDGDLALSKVVAGVVGETAEDWIRRAVPALGGLRPVDCLHEEPLRHRLQVCLERMP